MVDDWLLGLALISPTVAVIGAGASLVLWRKHHLRANSERSHRKELEHQLVKSQKFEILGSLVAEISHDLNNVLSVVLNASEMIGLDKNASEQTKRIIVLVDSAGHKGKDIIDHLLHFSRSGKSEPAVFDARDSVRDVRDLIGTLMPKRIKFTTEEPNESIMVNFNPSQLFQVMMNLCVNARDAIEGRGQVDLVLSREGQFAKVLVKDTGCGIPRDKLKKIFEPLYTTKPDGKGTGLGLSVVSHVLHNHNSKISVTSNVGVGTEFTIRIPLV